MKKRIVLLAVFLSLILACEAYGQGYENKADIYLDFNEEIQKCPYESIVTFKDPKEEGIQFNLCGKALLLFPSEARADTLSIENLKKVPFVKTTDVKNLVAMWRKDNHQSLMDYYDGVYPYFNKNMMFNTFLVETEEDKIIIYPVVWRYENAID